MKDEKRNRVVKIRLSDTEWVILNDKKSRPELARWIRETVLGIEPTKSIRVNSDFPPELARILAGMGNNLNQIANPDETAAIIDGSPYAKKYTSGVLSFEEKAFRP